MGEGHLTESMKNFRKNIFETVIHITRNLLILISLIALLIAVKHILIRVGHYYDASNKVHFVFKMPDKLPQKIIDRFSVPPHVTTEKVYLVGSFNNWGKGKEAFPGYEMKKVDDKWELDLELPVRHQYKFRFAPSKVKVTKNQAPGETGFIWIHDLENEWNVNDGSDRLNSLVEGIDLKFISTIQLFTDHVIPIAILAISIGTILIGSIKIFFSQKTVLFLITLAFAGIIINFLLTLFGDGLAHPTITYKSSQVTTSVYLTGEFCSWKIKENFAFKTSDNKTWAYNVHLPPGNYLYKIIAITEKGEMWITDTKSPFIENYPGWGIESSLVAWDIEGVRKFLNYTMLSLLVVFLLSRLFTFFTQLWMRLKFTLAVKITGIVTFIVLFSLIASMTVNFYFLRRAISQELQQSLNNLYLSFKAHGADFTDLTSPESVKRTYETMDKYFDKILIQQIPYVGESNTTAYDRIAVFDSEGKGLFVVRSIGAKAWDKRNPSKFRYKPENLKLDLKSRKFSDFPDFEIMNNITLIDSLRFRMSSFWGTAVYRMKENNQTLGYWIIAWGTYRMAVTYRNFLFVMVGTLLSIVFICVAVMKTVSNAITKPVSEIGRADLPPKN